MAHGGFGHAFQAEGQPQPTISLLEQLNATLTQCVANSELFVNNYKQNLANLGQGYVNMAQVRSIKVEAEEHEEKNAGTSMHNGNPRGGPGGSGGGDDDEWLPSQDMAPSRRGRPGPDRSVRRSEAAQASGSAASASTMAVDSGIESGSDDEANDGKVGGRRRRPMDGSEAEEDDAEDSGGDEGDGRPLKRLKYGGSQGQLQPASPGGCRRSKLPWRAVAVLRQWFNENSVYPYPNTQEKARLLQQTNLSKEQLNNWFTNQRKRSWRKPPPEELKRMKEERAREEEERDNERRRQLKRQRELKKAEQQLPEPVLQSQQFGQHLSMPAMQPQPQQLQQQQQQHHQLQFQSLQPPQPIHHQQQQSQQDQHPHPYQHQQNQHQQAQLAQSPQLQQNQQHQPPHQYHQQAQGLTQLSVKLESQNEGLLQPGLPTGGGLMDEAGGSGLAGLERLQLPHHEQLMMQRPLLGSQAVPELHFGRMDMRDDDEAGNSHSSLVFKQELDHAMGLASFVPPSLPSHLQG